MSTDTKCQAHGEEGCLRCAFQDTPNVPIIVNFLLDESGSMAHLTQSTIDSFNEHIVGLKAQQGVDYRFTLTKFSHGSHIVYSAQPLSKIKDLGTPDNPYRAEGGTALCDAVSETIAAISEKIKDIEEAKRPAVLVIILTDGEDTSSRKTTHKQIINLIAEKEKEGNWTFVMAGAGIDAWSGAKEIGISHMGNTRSTPATAKGVRSAMRAVTSSSVAYANSMSVSYKSGDIGSRNLTNYFAGADAEEDKDLVIGGTAGGEDKSKKGKK